MRKTVFLDRDGIINRKQPEGRYVTSWEEFEFLSRSKEACRLLTAADHRVIIVTNQRGVGRGIMSEDRLEDIHRRMLCELRECGARIDAIYSCTHDLGQCLCRKPETGLFLRARQDFPDIDFTESVVIGDSLSDLIAGSRLGCATLLVAEGDRRDTILHEAESRGVAIAGVYASLYDAVVSLTGVPLG